MRVCPFCRRTVKAEYPDLHYIEEKDIYIFTHFCELNEPSVSVTIIGKTKEEVIAKWNGEGDV